MQNLLLYVLITWEIFLHNSSVFKEKKKKKKKTPEPSEFLVNVPAIKNIRGISILPYKSL